MLLCAVLQEKLVDVAKHLLSTSDKSSVLFPLENILCKEVFAIFRFGLNRRSYGFVHILFKNLLVQCVKTFGVILVVVITQKDDGVVCLHIDRGFHINT